MLIDCTTCPGRNRLCGDCALAPLLLDETPGLPLTDDEASAVATFVGLGLVGEAEAASLRARHEPYVAAAAAG